MRAIAALFTVALTLASTSVALGQDDAREARRRPRVIVLDEIRIVGNVPRPFIFIAPPRVDYEGREMRTEMTRRIVESVDQGPF